MTELATGRQLCTALCIDGPEDELDEVAALWASYAGSVTAMRAANDRMRAPIWVPDTPAVPQHVRGRGSSDAEVHRLDQSSWAKRGETTAFAEVVREEIERGEIRTNAFTHAAGGSQKETPRSGALAGAVFAVKDNMDVAGERTRCGSAFFGEVPAERDAPVVRELRDAGAVYLGRTNMGEFALDARTMNPHYGDVANPWNLERGAGGSSGGAGAAVAAGDVDFALGTDSGGSVRIPAAMCGVVGFRPTSGSLSLEGIPGAAWTVDSCGVLAGTVTDIRIVMEHLTWPVAQAEERTRPWSIGVLGDKWLSDAEPDVRQAYHEIVKPMRSAGDFEVREVNLPDLELAATACAVIAYSEVGAQHHDLIRTRWREYGADVRTLVRLGQLLSASDYVEAQRTRCIVKRGVDQTMTDLDGIVTPTVPGVAPLRQHGSAVSASGRPAIGNVILFTAICNLLGRPSISIPAGLSDDGLPIGLQLIGRSYEDRALLAQAALIERISGFDAIPQVRRQQ